MTNEIVKTHQAILGENEPQTADINNEKHDYVSSIKDFFFFFFWGNINQRLRMVTDRCRVVYRGVWNKDMSVRMANFGGVGDFFDLK